MSRFVSWCLLLGLPACTTAEVATRRADQSIIGGQVAQPAEYPTVVALENEPGAWFCTGTLVAKDWILTAAHCVEGETADSVQIRFDDADINDSVGGKVAAVSEIHAHPDYDSEVWDNDVALVRLAAPVTDREPTPIHAPVVATATQVIEVGYGDADDEGGGAGVLRKLKTATIDCARTRDPGISGARVLCFDASDGTSSCYGDSGGPAFVELAGAVPGTLAVAGITSGGTADSCTRGYDIYTSVANELAFIEETMAKAPAPDPAEEPKADDGDAALKAGDDGGCSTGGGTSGLLGGALALLALRRRRRA